MAKFVDFYSDREVLDIMEAYLERFPTMFEGFDTGKIGFVTTKKKGKKAGAALKLHKVGYPHNVWVSKAYIVEGSDSVWKKLDQKRKNLSVFRAMCAIPQGGFDEQSKAYGKVKKPDIQMFTLEFAASGGVPNWEENPAAKDPMDQSTDQVVRAIPVAEGVEAIPADDGVERKAVSNEDIAGVVPGKTAAK